MTKRPVQALPRGAGVGSAWLDILNPKRREWQQNPALWAKERLGVTVWSKQKEILESVRDHSETAVHSCHEIGKSFTAALTACWWLDTHDPGTAFVVTTAPTQPQVEAILWREINRMHQKGDLPGRTNLTEWYMGKELVGLGRKPSEYNHSAFQGIHARYFLVIIDEACGVPKQIWDAASTLAANEHGKMLAIGNPDDPISEFAENCKEGSGWNTIGIGYADTPNFTKEGESLPKEITEQLISPRWVESRRKKWGEESALFISKCEGKFPTGADPFSTIPMSMVSKCRFLDLPEAEPIEAGIDVGAGNDRTIIYERRGRRAGRVAEFVDNDPMRTVGLLCEKLREWDITRVKIDSIGIGWGIAGRIKELSSRHNSSSQTTHSAEVVPVNFASRPSPGKERKYLNKRAEVWWEIGRENSRMQTWDLSTVDEDVIAELTTPRYELLDSYGKIKIEPKEEIRKRLDGASPDKADALLLAFIETTVGGDFSSAVALTQGSLLQTGRKLPTTTTQSRQSLKRDLLSRMGIFRRR
jgi:hypothetical protein